MPKISHHLDKKLRTRLRMYLVIAAIFALIVIYNIVVGDLSLFLSVLAIVVGLGVGILSAKMFRISWNKDARKIISRLDRFGVIIIILYVLFAIARRVVLAEFFPIAEVTALTFALAFGLILGRFLGMRRKIIKVLKEEKVLEI